MNRSHLIKRYLLIIIVRWLLIISGCVVVAGLTVGQVQGVGLGGMVGGMQLAHMSGVGGVIPFEGIGLRNSPSNSGLCTICNKTFRQLRSHIADVHVPTPTPCPMCGKIFSSKHKMFGHKYRSCPNRTKNLIRHLETLDRPQGLAASRLEPLSQTSQTQPGLGQAQQTAAHVTQPVTLVPTASLLEPVHPEMIQSSQVQSPISQPDQY